MNKCDKKIERVEKHLKKNCHDWQSVVALLKLKSEQFLKIEKEKQVEKLKKAYALKKNTTSEVLKMSVNKHSTDAVTEDVVRSFIQLSAVELHFKTLIEKRHSELANELIDFGVTEFQKFVENVETLKDELLRVTDLRRKLMLFVYELQNCVGDKEQWCNVKHYAMASITMFEAWQANQNDSLYEAWQESNALFIGALSRFIGTEITECAACFADMIKAGEGV